MVPTDVGPDDVRSKIRQMTSDCERVNGLATRTQTTADEDTNREIGFHGTPASYPVTTDGK